MDLKKIGKFIASLRKEKMLTQEELAEKLNVSSKTVSRWENGFNMPDVSLYKSLCSILDISLEELINGEKTNNKLVKQSVENAIISTMDSHEKVKKRLKKIEYFLLFSIFLFFILVLFSFSLYKKKYPNIDIYNIDVLESNKEELDLFLVNNDYNMYYYGISLQLMDANNNCYDLKSLIEHNQININDVRNYLDLEFNNGNIERYILYDGGTTIYKAKKYEAIFCNTLDGNRDIYFGKVDFENDLKGAFCGKDSDTGCYFTRTYRILNILEDNEYDFINVTLNEFQGSTVMIRMPRVENLQVGKNYEFTFRTYEVFEDNINNIFLNSVLIKVEETDKTGLNQVNDKICVNSY